MYARAHMAREVTRTLALVGIAATIAWAGVARAQPAPAAAPKATVPDEPRFPEALAPPPGFERDDAWLEYDRAFRDAAAGDIKAARTRLGALVARWPEHPARARAAALIEQLGSHPADPRAPSRVARGELVFWSTLGGVSLAANLCAALSCGTDREYAGAYTLSIGGALAASLAASRRGVRPGEAQLYNAVQTWGALNALAINDGFPDGERQAGIAIAMQLGGLAAGVGLWQAWRPSPGDVALANTFLLWGSVMTLWGHVIADAEPSWRSVVIAGDVSLAAGALVASQVEISREHTFLIDIGGVLGTLAGGLAATGTHDDTSAGIALMLGTAAGLGLAAAVTYDWDRPPPVKLAPAVLDGPGRSRGYGVAAGFTW